MKFRRRAATEPVEDPSTDPAEPTDEVDETGGVVAIDGNDQIDGDDELHEIDVDFAGPYDIDELPDDGIGRIDLGSLLLPVVEGLELRLQVDDASGVVQSVMLAGEEGAIELRAFAAPRNGDLWTEVIPQLAEDMTQRGGTAEEREGRFGAELVCQLTVQTPDGGTGVQASRIIGVNGPRWLLRATLLGRPAVEIETAGGWEDAIAAIGVRRGSHAMPVGEPLDVTLPPDAERVGEPD